MEFLNGVLFALACNLDTAAAAVALGAHGESLRLRDGLAAAGVTTAVTFLSLLLGAFGGALFPATLADRLGGLALTAIGLWYLLDTLRGVDSAPSVNNKSWITLSAALAVNNAGVGVAAGITGLSPVIASLANFAVTLAALGLGHQLGQKIARYSSWTLPASGILLVFLGLRQLV